MDIEIVSKSLVDVCAQTLVLTVFEGESNISFTGLDEKLSQKIQELLTAKELSGKYKEYTMFHSDGFNAARILIMGLGKRKDFTIERVMAVSAVAARNIRRVNLSDMAILNNFHKMDIKPEISTAAIVEGVNLGLYKFKKYTKEPQADYHTMKKLKIVLENQEVTDEIRHAAKKAEVLSESTNMVRDMVNEPANMLTPSVFAERAVKIANENGIKITVYGKEELQKENMNAFLAVNAGSVEPPRMVIMEIMAGKPEDKVLGLVGKGLTFDSGGLSIKSAESMFRMHCDMAGGAAVLGAMESIAKNKVPVNVVAVIPLTENLVDAHSYKVGDVLTTREGLTVEVLNTDAEGRLVLADALSFIRSYKKIDYLVDIATLTGAVVSALGHFCSGVMSNSQSLYSMMEMASRRSSERIWPLPLFEEYKMQISSDIADLENSGGKPAASITAAMFLKEFVGDMPWAHIDIAGTAYMGESTITYMKNPSLPREGGTGAGTRLLYYLAEVIAS